MRLHHFDLPLQATTVFELAIDQRLPFRLISRLRKGRFFLVSGSDAVMPDR
jgi:hypothetical protein